MPNNQCPLWVADLQLCSVILIYRCGLPEKWVYLINFNTAHLTIKQLWVALLMTVDCLCLLHGLILCKRPWSSITFSSYFVLYSGSMPQPTNPHCHIFPFPLLIQQSHPFGRAKFLFKIASLFPLAFKKANAWEIFKKYKHMRGNCVNVLAAAIVLSKIGLLDPNNQTPSSIFLSSFGCCSLIIWKGTLGNLGILCNTYNFIILL